MLVPLHFSVILPHNKGKKNLIVLVSPDFQPQTSNETLNWKLTRVVITVDEAL